MKDFTTNKKVLVALIVFYIGTMFHYYIFGFEITIIWLVFLIFGNLFYHTIRLEVKDKDEEMTREEFFKNVSKRPHEDPHNPYDLSKRRKKQ